MLSESASDLKRPEPLNIAQAGRAARFSLVGLAAIGDLVAVSAGYALGFVLRFHYGLFGEGIIGNSEPLPFYWPSIFLSVPFWVAIFAMYGLYESRPLTPVSELMRRVFHAVNMGAVALILWSFIMKVDLSRGWVVATYLATLATVTGSRIAFRKSLHIIRQQGRLGQNVLIVGINEEARSIYRVLKRSRWIGLRPVGAVIGGGEKALEVGDMNGLPVLGALRDIREIAMESGVTSVIVAGSALSPEKIARLYRELQDLPLEITVSAGLLNLAASRLSVEPLDGLAVFSLRKAQLPGPKAALKRGLDLIGALIAIVVFAPLMIGVAVAVKISSQGPVMFRQSRVGKDGKTFVIFKFRTMYSNAEGECQQLRAMNQAEGLLFKIREDPRVTRVGTILRRWALDEFPQLFNVVKGDMSLVGPRPPLQEEVEQYDDWLRGRLKVKPGITGLWQTNGRHELNFADYVRYDLYYVENWSPALDLYILWKTIPAVLSRRGSF